MATTNSIMTAEAYVKQVMNKANAVYIEINRLKIRQKKLNSELGVYNTQQAIKKAILDYTKKVDGIVKELTSDVRGVQGFFKTPRGSMVTPAHLDLPPADTTLQLILTGAKEVAGRLYQSMVNVNYTITVMADTAHTLATALGATPASSSDQNQSGFLHYNNEPNDGLYTKMKAAVTAGMSTLQKLANTYLGFVQFLHQVEGLYYEAMHVEESLGSEIHNLNAFQNRNQIRISTELQYVDKLQDLINQTNHHLSTVESQLQAAEVDHNMLTAEFHAANESINPQKKLSASSVKST